MTDTRCDHVVGKVGKPSRRCGRKASLMSHRAVGIEQSPMRLAYCSKHAKFAAVTDYKTVRVISVETL